MLAPPALLDEPQMVKVLITVPPLEARSRSLISIHARCLQSFEHGWFPFLLGSTAHVMPVLLRFFHHMKLVVRDRPDTNRSGVVPFLGLWLTDAIGLPPLA